MARLLKWLKLSASWLGIDRAIQYTLIGRGWGVVSGPITLAMVGRHLQPDEQGFFYTFGSVLGLNVFLELGLSYVILQFASHEKACLEWDAFRQLRGPAAAIARLSAIVKMTLRWYACAAVLAIAVILPAGILVFSKVPEQRRTVEWLFPWTWLAIVSAMNLFVSPLYSILEGCGRVSHIASMRAAQGVIANVGLWVTLWVGGGLLASPLFQTINLTIGLAWLGFNYGAFFRRLLRAHTEDVQFRWWSEVWPFQWRIAVSWLSGYFIFQLFTPILLMSHGAVPAGQMGMSLSLCNALLSVSIAWMVTKASPFGALVAARRWVELDALFFRTMKQSFFVMFTGSLCALAGVVILKMVGSVFSARVLGPVPFAVLLVSTLMNHIVFCEAQYLRTHKTEPLLLPSVANAAITFASTSLLAPRFGTSGVVVAYMLSCCISLIWVTSIFRLKRRAWHVPESPVDSKCVVALKV